MSEGEFCSYTNPDTGEGCQCLSWVPSAKREHFLAHDPLSNRKWCLIHHPHGDTKDSWTSDRKTGSKFKQQIETIAIKSDPIDLSGGRLVGPLFPNLRRDKALILNNAEIKGDLLLRGPVRSIQANGLKIEGSIHLPSVVAKDVELEAAEISGALSIAKVHGSLKAKGLAVDGTVTISEMGNSGECMVSFEGARIGGDLEAIVVGKNDFLDLRDATVDGGINIQAKQSGITMQASRLAVSGTARIVGPFRLIVVNDATFNGQTTFIGTVTELRANRAKVYDLLTFENFVVDTLQLRGLESKSVFSMIGATVRKLLDCGDVKFEELAYFMATTIEAATFEGARFNSTAMFCGTSFVRGANFQNITAIHELDFTPEWKSDKFDVEAKILPGLSFDGSQVDELNFSGREFVAEATFAGVTFNKAPNFFNCILHESITFPLNLKNYKDRRPKSRLRYRTLKQKMETARTRPEEALFFSLEQYCSKSHLSWVGRLISSFYGYTSHYGWSIGMPIFCLFVWALLFTLIFGQIEVGSFELPGDVDMDAAAKGAKASLQNVFLPFYAVRDSDKSVAEILLSLLQSLVGVALIAETLLAVRWRFRRG